MSSLRNQSGQAMTEMVVTSSMILIPLFLLIPLLGKYIDINHSTIQAARYEAWEYSVWYRSSNNTPTGVENEKGRQVQLPIKRFQDIEHEAKQRFFTKQKTQIKRNDSSLTDDPNPLWKDHRGVNILTGGINDVTSGSINQDNDTPSGVTTAAFSFLIDLFDKITTGVASISNFFSGSKANFDVIDLKGYAKAKVNTPITSAEGLTDFKTINVDGRGNIKQKTSLTFDASASVLTNGWSAGGTPHFLNKAGGITVTKILSDIANPKGGFPGLNTVMSLMGELAPELSPCSKGALDFIGDPLGIKVQTDPDRDGSLWLGYLDVEAVPGDALVDENGDTFGQAIPDCVDGICKNTYSVTNNLDDPSILTGASNTYFYPHAHPAVNNMRDKPQSGDMGSNTSLGSDLIQFCNP